MDVLDFRVLMDPDAVQGQSNGAVKSHMERWLYISIKKKKNHIQTQTQLYSAQPNSFVR